MKKSILLILGIIVCMSCEIKDDDNLIEQFGEVCVYKAEIKSPNGFEVNVVGEINFTGGVQAFQFLDEEIGFAMLTKNLGGSVEVFKTIDGGQSWHNLNIGINQDPISMAFKNENFGIITVLDFEGCSQPDCPNKCVILKTENGGLDWEEVEYEGLKGGLHHPQYDSNGNLYANLSFKDQCIFR